jgi:ArsR family transcriptional regulator, arsenate/arsenite/antimonite-responsive transcriptional repressor
VVIEGRLVVFHRASQRNMREDRFVSGGVNARPELVAVATNAVTLACDQLQDLSRDARPVDTSYAPLTYQENLLCSPVMPTVVASDTARAAALFHALSDEIRLDVIGLLQHGERCVCELMADLDIAQSRLSWHLKTLSDVGIIAGRREGKWNYYSLNAEAFAEARSTIDSMKPAGRRLPTRTVCCD